MARSFVFYNNKGGVGKTTLAFNFAVELSFRFPLKNVLLVDMDAQTNTSALCFGGVQSGARKALSKQAVGKGIKEVITQEIKNKGAADFKDFMINIKDETNDSHYPANLNLICGSIDLDLFASQLDHRAEDRPDHMNPTPFYDVYSLLSRLVGKLGDEWLVVMDTNPCFNIITRMALLACEELIIPSTIDEFSSGGVRTLFSQLGVKFGQDDEKLFRISSFSQLIETAQTHELNSLSNLGRACPKLQIAKIRTVVFNRHKKKEKLTKAQQSIHDSILELLAEAYVKKPDLFANPHHGERKEFKSVSDIATATEFVETHYFSVVHELEAAMNICQAKGYGITTLDRKKDSSGQLGVDCTFVGLEIQDLVELAMCSSRAEQYRVTGGYATADEKNRTVPKFPKYYQYMIAPCSQADYKCSRDANALEKMRRGRRILDSEFLFNVSFQKFRKVKAKKRSRDSKDAPTFSEGEKVLARFGGNTTKYYPGTIQGVTTKQQGEYTYHIKYNDGDEELRVLEMYIKRARKKTPKKKRKSSGSGRKKKSSKKRKVIG